LFYSGKKKKHSLKTQVVVDKKTRKVICTHLTQGRRHDFRLFKDSQLKIPFKTEVLVDTGYVGIAKFHKNSALPRKRSKKKPLSQADRAHNQALAQRRVLNENVIGCLKKFKILSDRYRNRRKRFGLRFTLIAAIYNFEILL